MIIDTSRQIELLLEHEKHILDMVAAQKPLASILETISQRVEVQFPNTYCSIMLLDTNEGVLFSGASSSLPESIRDVLDQGMVIGACAANCDTAGYRRQPVLVSDIREIPLWQGWHHLFAENGIVACSTFPIVEAAGAVLGTFSLYYDRAYMPTGNEQQVIERMSCLAGIAIGRAKEQKSLRDSEQRFRDFAEIAADWFWETDAQLRLTYLSENHQIITDLSLADSLGRYFDELYKTESIPVHSYAEDTDPGRNAGSAGKKFRFEETSLIIRETRLVRADGDEIDIYLQAKRLFDADGKFIGCRGIGRDITAQRRLNEKIVYQASHDPLTGLLNRRAFQAQLEKAVADARKNNKAYVFCFIDLDQFKLVNDSVGHVAGDELLKAVSGLILTEIRSIDVLGRLGGDEFGLLLRACPLSKAKDIAEAMLQKLRAYCFRWHEREFYIQASIGIVAIGAHAHSATELMAQADLACFCAKEQGRNQVVIYDEKVMQDNSALASATRWLDAFQQQRLLLYAQPIRSLQTADDQFPWYEILLRLQDNDGSLVAPRPFVLAAEHFGLMASVDHWVIQQALKELKKLLKRDRKARFSINLSGISLDSNNLAEFIINQLRYHGIPADGVCFEITETAAIRNLSEATRLIEKLREFGCHFALDDFGSGLSSFTYLKYLPVGFLKIDGGFIVDMLTEATDYAMVEAIHNIGSKLNLVTIAESVESVAIVDALRDIGVDYAQGYALAYPQPCAHIHTGGVVIPPNVAGNS